MSKKERHEQTLASLLEEFFESGNTEKITKYMVLNSSLPGPRGNLELARAFADLVRQNAEREPEKLYSLCKGLTAISAKEAPVNDPKEFISFCGTVGLGSLGTITPAFQEIVATLQMLANDPRWRVRESVAWGLQTLLEERRQETLRELESWIKKNNWLEMRAVAAGVAEPTLLRDEETARSALELHKKILRQVLKTTERRSVEFKTLRKGLAYTLSVVIQAIPKEGFRHLHQIIESQDPDVLWIVKQNLKKNRLIKNFPREVASARKLLER
ncbi:MAG: hypothetical protein JSW01_04090 [Candidatus Bathyarchaeota archaeon]|nr:MAG: hypothetical protein JSW01_04090 [Candidatus Bathyarchaeota archaeon]